MPNVPYDVIAQLIKVVVMILVGIKLVAVNGLPLLHCFYEAGIFDQSAGCNLLQSSWDVVIFPEDHAMCDPTKLSIS